MFLLFFCFNIFSQVVSSGNNAKAEDFLREFNLRGSVEKNKFEVADWRYATNVSSKEAIASLEAASLKYNAFLEEARLNASEFASLGELSEDFQRQLKLIRLSWTLSDPQDKKIKMRQIYSTTRVYDPETRMNLSLSPDLTNTMSNTYNAYSTLNLAWQGWRDAVGPEIKPLFEEYVELVNQRARENDFSNYGTFLRELHEVRNLPELVKTLWEDLEPFYKELHAYVRSKLSDHFPQSRGDSAIPAHVLGSMWADSWVGTYPLVKPYKRKPGLDATLPMREKNYTIEDMFRVAESFFVSLGFGELPGKFQERSMIRKPEGRDVECHSSAWDMFTQGSGKDVRIQQCTEVTQDWLVTTHREMAHVYYYMSFWDQPFIYRDSVDPAFYQAVGDMMSLFASKPQYLADVGLLKNYVHDDEGTEINALMKMALDNIAFLPFGYLMDQWRWGVFEGKIKPSEYNTEWWKLRTKYQGIKPPITRTEKDFDPGANYLIANDAKYVRSVLSKVLQFQFHKAACKAADFEGPLHQCSIYKSAAAGKKIRKMLQLGNSKPWSDTLKTLIDKRTVDARPMKEYFWPLYLWLRNERCTSKYKIGWPENQGPDGDPCVVPTTLPDTEVTMTPQDKKANSKAHGQCTGTAEKLIMTVFAALLCLNFQVNLVKSF